MAAAKKSSGRKSAKKSAAKKTSAKKTSAKKTSAKQRAAAKKGGQASGRKQSARKRATSAARKATRPAAQATEFSGKAVAEFRNALTRNLIRPLELVMLTRERIEDALDEVVKRGRMTRDDARQLGEVLYGVGRQQTDDLMKDLEQLLGRGRTASLGGATKDARSRAKKQAGQAVSAARRAADPLLAQADRARRAAGVGPSFPITGYDDLTASQIQARLQKLTPAELRKVRDYERRRGNRKSVLDAIETKL